MGGLSGQRDADLDGEPSFALACTTNFAERPEWLARVECDLEALVYAEGLAMCPGPRPHLDTGLLSRLRETITTCRVVEFRYFTQSTR